MDLCIVWQVFKHEILLMSDQAETIAADGNVTDREQISRRLKPQIMTNAFSTFVVLVEYSVEPLGVLRRVILVPLGVLVVHVDGDARVELGAALRAAAAAGVVAAELLAGGARQRAQVVGERVAVAVELLLRVAAEDVARAGVAQGGRVRPEGAVRRLGPGEKEIKLSIIVG